MDRIHTDKPWKGHFVRAWRKHKNLTIEQVASRLAEKGVDAAVSTLSKIETGKTNLTEERIHQLSDALGIEPGALFLDPELYHRRERRLKSVDQLSDEQIEKLVALAQTLKQA